MSNPIRTKEDVQKYLGSLEDLHQLVRELEQTNEQREQPPNFYILGRFHILCSRLVPLDIDWKAQYPDIPDVLTFQEFFTFIKERGYKDNWFSGGGIGDLTDYALPPPHVICSLCGCGWNIQTCHDAAPSYDREFRGGKRDSEVVKLDGFVGKTLGEARDAYLQKKDKRRVYVCRFGPSIRNDKYKDATASEYDIRNQRGYRSDREGITWEHVIEPGDEMSMEVLRYYHRGCHMKLEMRKREDELFRCVRRAGFTSVFIEAPTIDRLKREPDDEEDEETDEMVIKSRAFTVHTDEGTFGFAYFDPEPPAIDISGTGLSLLDLVSEKERRRAPPEAERMTFFSLMDDKQLKKLCRVLRQKKTK